MIKITLIMNLNYLKYENTVYITCIVAGDKIIEKIELTLLNILLSSLYIPPNGQES